MYLIDLQYFGNLYYYSTLIKNNSLVFCLSEGYERRLHVNRTWIMGSNKLIGLSIPLEGGRKIKQLFRDVKISGSDWKRVHWRTIHDCYRKSPWFEEYAPALQSQYTRKTTFLWDWNLETINLISKICPKLNVKMSEIQECIGSTLLPDCSPPILEIPANYPRYRQVFSDRMPFAGNLSILDLLLNEGPATCDYLQRLLDFFEKA